MAQKSDYAFVLSCTPGYGFGMISTMNAQSHFGTDADWEVAYEGYTNEAMAKISAAFPFNVNWTPISELMKAVVDKRTNAHGSLERCWLSYWLLAHKLLKEKKYKAVCIIQADSFIFVNVDTYFKIAESGVMVSGEHACSKVNAEDLPFGNDKGLWGRYQCALFDSVNFIGQQYTQLPIDIVHFQEEDAFKEESNYSIVALNRGVCTHVPRNKLLGLERNIWVCDTIWSKTKLYIDPIYTDRVYNDRGIQLKGWHCRWWQNGRVSGEWANNKSSILANKEDTSLLKKFELKEHNYALVRDFMVKFNAMTPAVASDNYYKGKIKRPRWEDGEE